MVKNQALKPLNGYRAEKLIHVLTEEITSVKNVKDWTKKTEISETSMYRVLIEAYDKTPGEIIKEVRYEKILREIEQDIEACVYSIAVNSGFVSEAALRMFLRRCYGTNVSTLRREILSGKYRMYGLWLD